MDAGEEQAAHLLHSVGEYLFIWDLSRVGTLSSSNVFKRNFQNYVECSSSTSSITVTTSVHYFPQSIRHTRLRPLCAGPSKMDDEQHFSRFQPCYLLFEAKIPCVVWCEDAVAHYGVPTIVFQLYVLVPDIDKAANILVLKGWSVDESAQTKFGNAPLKTAHHCLSPMADSDRDAKLVWTPGVGPPPLPSNKRPGSTTTILLPAADWNFCIPKSNQHPYNGYQAIIFPSLAELLDALIDKLLDDSLTDSMFWGHLAVLIAYLYGYVPALREKSFAEKLKYDHPQFHFDYLSGMSIGAPFIRHERPIRDALRKGTYQLRDCSANHDDGTLFTAKTQAQIMASMPSPFSPEDYEKAKQEFWASEMKDADDTEDVTEVL